VTSVNDSLLSWLVELSKIDLATLTEAERVTVSQAIEEYERQRDALDPVNFATNVLDIKPWSKQSEILRAVDRYARVAVRSGHKIGKSTSAAILALWWMHRWPDGRVVMTAPTGRQVRIVLWREVTRLYRRARTPLGGELHKVPDQGLQYEDGREIVGFATDEPERIAGVSGAHVLYIVDEGSGVDEVIYEAIEGNRAGGAKLVVFGNPTQTSGTFYNAFTSAKDKWHTIHVSSEDSPNVTGECEIPGLATPDWVKEKLEEWGENSPLFQVRVSGNFPVQSENSVIGIGLVEAAARRYEDTLPDGPLEIGVDVARYGDDESVIWPCRGNKPLRPTVLNSMDNVEVAGKVMEVVRALRREGERPVVKVDVIGVGSGVCDILKRHRDIMVIEVNVGEAANVLPNGESGYNRLRDQLWFGVKEWLKAGGALPDDAKLHAELLAPKYGFTVTGHVKVESKEDIKKRLKRSPDRADALALAIYKAKKTGAWLYTHLEP
jgi:hypothetical protein